MSLRIAQCTSSSQQSVTGSIFQRPHGKKAPQNGHHRFGVNGHVEIQTFFPEDHNINQGNENEWHTLHIDTLILPAIILKIVCSAGPSSSERQIAKGDNTQNYGGKDQCIYM